jgi:hypothetical protein
MAQVWSPKLPSTEGLRCNHRWWRPSKDSASSTPKSILKWKGAIFHGQLRNQQCHSLRCQWFKNDSVLVIIKLEGALICFAYHCTWSEGSTVKCLAAAAYALSHAKVSSCNVLRILKSIHFRIHVLAMLSYR